MALRFSVCVGRNRSRGEHRRVGKGSAFCSGDVAPPGSARNPFSTRHRGAGAGGPNPTQHPPGPSSVLRDPPAYQHWQGPWLASSASWVPPPGSGLGFRGAENSGGLAGGGHLCDPPSPGPGSGPTCQHRALAMLPRLVSLAFPPSILTRGYVSLMLGKREGEGGRERDVDAGEKHGSATSRPCPDRTGMCPDQEPSPQCCLAHGQRSHQG